jgi:hypothetical protein
MGLATAVQGGDSLMFSLFFGAEGGLEPPCPCGRSHLKLVAVPHPGGRRDDASQVLPTWVKHRETAEAGYGRFVLAHEGDDDLQTAAHQLSPQ